MTNIKLTASSTRYRNFLMENAISGTDTSLNTVREKQNKINKKRTNRKKIGTLLLYDTKRVSFTAQNKRNVLFQ